MQGVPHHIGSLLALIRRVVGGAVPLCPPRHAPLGAPLEPEAGSNLFNSKLTYIQIFYFSYQSTVSQFVHFMIISQILSCTLILFTFFFRGVSFKMIGNYGQMTNSQPSGRLIKILNFIFSKYWFFKGGAQKNAPP